MRVLIAAVLTFAAYVYADESEETAEPATTKALTTKKPRRAAPAADNCMTSCGTIPECMSSQLQSQCLNDGTCLGLYRRPNGRICYQLGSIDTCGNGEKSPLPCGSVVTTTTPMPDPCIGWCSEVSDCDESPAGSFCQPDGTCYGLFDRIAEARCYAFFGQGCGLSSPLIPVSCGIYTTTTADPCVTTTTVDPCVSTTTVDPCSTTTPCPPEPGRQPPKAAKDEDAMKWYYEQLAEFHKQNPSQPRPVAPSAQELAAERWGNNLAPSFAKKASGSVVCESYCRNSPACALAKSSCISGVCSKLFTNSLGKVCYKTHPRACSLNEFTQITC
jgi:hypothetical protein